MLPLSYCLYTIIMSVQVCKEEFHLFVYFIIYTPDHVDTELKTYTSTTQSEVDDGERMSTAGD